MTGGSYRSYLTKQNIVVGLIVLVFLVWVGCQKEDTSEQTPIPVATKVPKTCISTVKLLIASGKGIMTQEEIRKETLQIYKESSKDSQELQEMAEALLRAATANDGEAFRSAMLEAQDICVPAAQ